LRVIDLQEIDRCGRQGLLSDHGYERGPKTSKGQLRDAGLVTDRDRQSLERLLDAMDDHYDQRISDEQFVLQAVSARSSLGSAAIGDPDMAPAVRALEDFVKAARGGPLPLNLYGALRRELANLPPPPGWRAYGPWRTFSLRVLQSSWGIAIDLRARSAHCDAFPPDATLASGKVALAVADVDLGAQDIGQLLRGLTLMAPAIQRARPNANVLVELGAVTFTPTDYQPEGLAVAIISWSAEEFQVNQVDWDLAYDKTTNRYALRL
jgi:hypothetical protein